MNKEIIGLVAGILTASSLLPQLITTVKKRTASEVSVFMFVILLFGNGLWAYYGILLKDIPIISTNAFSFILNILMLILKGRFAKNEKKSLNIKDLQQNRQFYVIPNYDINTMEDNMSQDIDRLIISFKENLPDPQTYFDDSISEVIIIGNTEIKLYAVKMEGIWDVRAI